MTPAEVAWLSGLLVGVALGIALGIPIDFLVIRPAVRLLSRAAHDRRS